MLPIGKTRSMDRDILSMTWGRGGVSALPYTDEEASDNQEKSVPMSSWQQAIQGNHLRTLPIHKLEALLLQN